MSVCTVSSVPLTQFQFMTPASLGTNIYTRWTRFRLRHFIPEAMSPSGAVLICITTHQRQGSRLVSVLSLTRSHSEIIVFDLNKVQLKNRRLTGEAHVRRCSGRVTQGGGKHSDRWFAIPWTKLMGDHRKAALQQHDHVQMRSLSVLPEISRSQTKLTSRPHLPPPDPADQSDSVNSSNTTLIPSRFMRFAVFSEILTSTAGYKLK